jgi:hypothetical protein
LRSARVTGIPAQARWLAPRWFVVTGGASWWWADRENNLLGRHGRLSAEETLIPLYVLAL